MGKTAPLIPSSYRTIADTIARGGSLKAQCDTCGKSRELDRLALERIRHAKGADYSLIGRRSPCRFTPGCAGWVRFFYWNAFWWPLWRDKDDTRWLMKRD